MSAIIAVLLSGPLATGLAAQSQETNQPKVSLRGRVDTSVAVGMDPYAYYPFNGNADDESGNAFHGTVVGATLVEDRFGNPDSAYSFDGVDDYIALPDNNPVWLPVNDFTLSVWVKSGVSGQILDMNGATSCCAERRLGYGLGRGHLETFGFSAITGNGSQHILRSKTAIPGGQWHHIVAVRAGTFLGIYVDGILDASGPCGSAPIDFAGSYDDDKVSIGRSTCCPPWGQPSYFLDGSVDDLEVYDVALSGAEIQALYELGKPPLRMTPLSVAFGKVVAGEPVRESVTVTNVGNSDLHVGPITIRGAAPFMVEPLSPFFGLAPNESAVLDIRFTPLPGIFSASLDVPSSRGSGSVPLGGTGCNPSPVHDNSLVGQYSFNGGALDQSVYCRHGIVHGATPAVDRFGIPRSAYRFDGVDDYVALPDNEPVWLPVDDFTLSVWVNFSRGSPDGSILDLNVARSSFPDRNLGYALGRSSKGRVGFSMTTKGGVKNDLVSRGLVPEQSWHHIVAVRAGTFQGIYIDGLLDASRACRAAPVEFVGGYDDDKVNIGRSTRAGRWPPSAGFVSGLIDDIRIYDRALSEGEILQLYNELPTANAMRSFAAELVSDALDFTTGLPRSSVSTQGNQHALCNFMTQAVRHLERGDFGLASERIRKAIDHTDGCALREGPDSTGGGPVQDALLSCGDQAQVYPPLLTALDISLIMQPPLADFSASPTVGTAPLDVTFDNLSSTAGSTYGWGFGDGKTSTLANPSHTYTAKGDYTVNLTVTRVGGVDSETKTSYISVADPPAPVAHFSGAPTSGPAPLSVSFTNLSAGDIGSYLWDFGDGNTSTARNPTHEYGDPGEYTVSLTVNGLGASDTETKADYVAVFAVPVPRFSGTPTSGIAPLSVDFSDLSTGPITSWSWDFGDGNTSALQNPSHTYVRGGSFTVTLTVAGPGGTRTTSKGSYITVIPTVDFSGTPTSGTAPLQVSFTDLTSGTVTAWTWDFGDGNISELQNPVHTYTAPGTYSVILVVRGPFGFNGAMKTDYITVF